MFGLKHVKSIVLAEQSGSSPDSGATSRIKATYDSINTLLHGSESAGGWGDWGTWWNRIRSAGEWVPDGTAAVGEVPSGLTFYAGDSRSQKAGTLHQNLANMAYDDWNCSANNAEATGDCAGGDSEYIGEEGTWTKTAEGGIARTVTDNAV
ncbi:unnamed protein product, partial [marine sediment metagenome]